MTEWKAKRFWTKASVEDAPDGYRVCLDGKPLNTPGKLPLILPTRAMAAAIAAEWDAQQGEIRPLTMPCTRSANSAIERVIPQHAEVAEMLSAYGETDLLCYRAERPEDLTQRQAEAWDPLLDWAAQRYGARLRVGAGIVPVEQDADAMRALARVVAETGPFAMAALHDLVTLTGSLVLGLAVSEGRLSAANAWFVSRIDEDWQIEQWGDDDEAVAAAAARQAQLIHAETFWRLSFAR
jgi:chaperone required for assembly of F1-ATPase